MAEFLTSTRLAREGFRHAFFTRRGGASSGPYATLSFSLTVGDEPAAVEENHRRAAAVLGVEPARLLYLSQVHGAAVVVAEPAIEREACARIEGDALLARSGRLACGVRSADCVPILLADPVSGAVGAVHAGWRGVEAGVAVAAVAALAGAGGAGRLVAAIGPHIGPRAFEVGEDVAARLVAASPKAAVVTRDGGRTRIDLRAIVRAQLRAAGLPDDAIDDVRGCTYSEPERFHSYRRDGATSGRHLSAIVPRST
ncbi:MAG: peptidoglycan editing factor PgeF [Polyangiaceae bacterium]|nr:peptidoglycan editing factor PgeF [Polyangiaceae bacterium]